MRNKGFLKVDHKEMHIAASQLTEQSAPVLPSRHSHVKELIPFVHPFSPTEVSVPVGSQGSASHSLISSQTGAVKPDISYM